MGLHVTYFATYLTTTNVKWRDDDHGATKFIKAIKGIPFGGWATIPVLGLNYRLNKATLGEATKWFGEMAADYLLGPAKLDTSGGVGLVPFPSRGALKGVEPDKYASKELAKAIEESLRARKATRVRVTDILRWTEQRPGAHDQGGSRDPNDVIRYLTVTQQPALATYIIVDDVVTSGARMRAAHALLDQYMDVLCGLSAGRTVQEPPDDPWAVVTEALQSFAPK